MNNIVDADTGFGLEGPLALSKSEFGTMFKSWCKKVKEAILAKGDKPKPFMQSAQGFLPFLNAEFKNFEIYQTKSFSSHIVGWWDEASNASGAPAARTSTSPSRFCTWPQMPCSMAIR